MGTALFYVTFGRNASVSDVTYIIRTSGLSKGEVSLLVGGIAAMHALRVGRDERYGHFFLRPTIARPLSASMSETPIVPEFSVRG